MSELNTRFLRTAAVLNEVDAERERQDAKWGEQNHRDGTGSGLPHMVSFCAEDAKSDNARHVKFGTLTWADILWEEVLEALEETDTTRLRAELIQVAAVAAAWVEAIDRRPTTCTICDGKGEVESHHNGDWRKCVCTRGAK